MSFVSSQPSHSTGLENYSAKESAEIIPLVPQGKNYVVGRNDIVWYGVVYDAGGGENGTAREKWFEH